MKDTETPQDIHVPEESIAQLPPFGLQDDAVARPGSNFKLKPLHQLKPWDLQESAEEGTGSEPGVQQGGAAGAESTPPADGWALAKVAGLALLAYWVIRKASAR